MDVRRAVPTTKTSFKARFIASNNAQKSNRNNKTNRSDHLIQQIIVHFINR